MKKILIILLVFGFAFLGQAQCPTVDNPNQSFCAANSPRVSSLVATNNGGGLLWYSNATGGTPLSVNTVLQNGVTYYADDNANTCSPRPSVTVAIFGAPPADVDVAVTRCSSQDNTIAQLDAVGSNIAWFDAQTGGTFLPATTELVNGATYWVQQTQNGCTSVRLPTTVTIISPGAPTGAQDQTFCVDPSSPVVPTVADLVVDGTSINWYDSPSLEIQLDDTTPLDNGTTYYATQTTFPCESVGSLAVTVTLETLPNPGSDTSVEFCDDISGFINLIDFLNGSPDSGGTWSGDLTTTNGDLGTIDASLLELDPGVYNFTYTLAAQVSCPQTSANLTLNVRPAPNSGNDNTLEICGNDDPIDLFTLLGDADAGGVWIPALASGTGVYDPQIDNAPSYTYRVSATAPCTTASESTITINKERPPVAGGSATINRCDDTTEIINLIDVLSGEDPGGAWTGDVALTNGSQGTLDLGQLGPGTYIFNYTVAAVNLCADAIGTVTVVITTTVDAGEDVSLTLCGSDMPINLFEQLGGNPNTGGSWIPALNGSEPNVLDPTLLAPGSYTYEYRVNEAAPCTGFDSSFVTLTIEEPKNAGTDASINFCSSDSPADLFATLGVDAQSGGSWSPALTSGTGVFDPAVDAAGVYTYTVAATQNCPEDSAAVTVTVDAQQNAGDDNSVAFCSNDVAVDLITFLGANVSTGGVWSPLPSSGTGIFDPSVDAAGIYTYTVAANGLCAGDSATLTITISNAPNAGDSATLDICGDNSSQNLFDLLGASADLGGSWSGPSTLGNGDQGTFDPATMQGGDYTYTVAGSGACDDALSVVTINLTNPFPGLLPNGNIFCSEDNPTVGDLIANITASEGDSFEVYENSSGGLPFPQTNLLVDGQTYHVLELDTTTGCSGSQRLAVTVQINDPAIPTLSETNLVYCQSEGQTVATLNGFIVTGNNVLWFLDTDVAQPLSEVTPLITGNYLALEEDAFGCRSALSAPIAVQVNDAELPTLAPDGNNLCGIDVPTVLTLQNNLTIPDNTQLFWWADAQQTQSLTLDTLLADETTYFVSALNNDNGCESVSPLSITVDLNNCNPEDYPILIPEAFSPNGDGINDVLELEGIEFVFENFTLEIYNRYGSKVYQGSLNTPFWDGTSNQSGGSSDRVLPNGVYFYIMNYNRDDLSPQQGYIYLNR